MRRLSKVIAVRVVMLATLFLWGCFFSVAINITGTWDGTMTWTSGPANGFVYSLRLDLTHEGREVTGTVTLHSHSTYDFEIPIVQGSARSGNISLIARGTNPWVPGEPTIEFAIDGSYDQSGMAGEGTQSIDGTTYAFTYSVVLTTEPVTETSLLRD